jgi:hypothetical protein
LLDRFTSTLLVIGITLHSWFWSTYRFARRRSRLTAGVAAVALAAVAGVTAGVLAGSAPPAQAGSNPSGVRNAAAVRPASHPHQTAKQHGAAQHAVGQHGAGRQAPSQHAAPAQRPAQTPIPATAARPYSIYDSVTPSAIPANQYSVATYANGHYAATGPEVAGRGSVLWIDTNATSPSASVLDVEPGDATPSAAASWAWHKLNSDPSSLARIYTMRSEWPAVRAAISALPSQMQSHIRYWIADPTGVQHLVPGSDATQWYWGSHYDITTANPGF